MTEYSRKPTNQFFLVAPNLILFFAKTNFSEMFLLNDSMIYTIKMNKSKIKCFLLTVVV